MPGTGKTTTIAHLINRLVSLGKKVLVSSYTHSAVDNVMRKLDEMGQKSLLRIGGSDRVAPDIKKYSVEDAGCETVSLLSVWCLCDKVHPLTQFETRCTNMIV